eukprot:g11058.t1
MSIPYPLETVSSLEVSEQEDHSLVLQVGRSRSSPRWPWPSSCRGSCGPMHPRRPLATDFHLWRLSTLGSLSSVWARMDLGTRVPFQMECPNVCWKIPDRMPDRMSEVCQFKIDIKAQEDMPEGMSEGMSEDVPDRMHARLVSRLYHWLLILFLLCAVIYSVMRFGHCRMREVVLDGELHAEAHWPALAVDIFLFLGASMDAVWGLLLWFALLLGRFAVFTWNVWHVGGWWWGSLPFVAAYSLGTGVLVVASFWQVRTSHAMLLIVNSWSASVLRRDFSCIRSKHEWKRISGLFRKTSRAFERCFSALGITIVMLILSALIDLSHRWDEEIFATLAVALFLPGVLWTNASTTTACNRLPSLVMLLEADDEEEDAEYMDLAMFLHMSECGFFMWDTCVTLGFVQKFLYFTTAALSTVPLCRFRSFVADLSHQASRSGVVSEAGVWSDANNLETLRQQVVAFRDALRDSLQEVLPEAAAGLTFHAEDAVRPTTKVVKLLQGMQEQLDSEAKADEETYDKFKCWCHENTVAKEKAVKEAEMATTELKDAAADRLKAEVETTEDEVAKNQAALDTATHLRRQQNKERFSEFRSRKDAEAAEAARGPDGLPRRTPEEFTDDLERLNSDLSGVTSAITAMAVAGEGAFLQSKETAARPLREILGRHAAKLNMEDRQAVESFLQRGDGVDTVKGVLEGLKDRRSCRVVKRRMRQRNAAVLFVVPDDFTADLVKIKDDEATSTKQYEALAAAKTEEIQAGIKQIETKKEEKANADEERGAESSPGSLWDGWVYCTPLGVPHKRVGDVIVPAFLKTDQLFDLSERWQVGEKDVLLALSPGLCPNIQAAQGAQGDAVVLAVFVVPSGTDHLWGEENTWTVLEPIFALAGDPLQAKQGGPVDGACEFRHRMLELLNEEEPPNPGAVLVGAGRPPPGHPARAPKTQEIQVRPSANRCLFSLLPPWLVPQSFGKVAVFLADPRYLIMRQLRVWEIFKKCNADKGKGCGCGSQSLDESDFLREEMQRLARWALEEHRQPDKVKIFFVEDFVAEPDMALRGLARFLGVPDDAEVLQQAIAKDMLELQHFLTVAMDFELRLAELPDQLQMVWEETDARLLPQEKVSLWPRLPNLRLAMLGQSLQNYRAWVAPQWWAAHSAGLCKPCSFAPRGICRSGDDCDFCHAPSHRAPLRRPSKKARMRRLRKALRDKEGDGSSARTRTPSPDGLSS